MEHAQVGAVIIMIAAGSLCVGVAMAAYRLALRYPDKVIQAKREAERLRARRERFAREARARIAKENEKLERRGALSPALSDEAGRVSFGQDDAHASPDRAPRGITSRLEEARAAAPRPGATLVPPAPKARAARVRAPRGAGSSERPVDMGLRPSCGVQLRPRIRHRGSRPQPPSEDLFRPSVLPGERGQVDWAYVGEVRVDGPRPLRHEADTGHGGPPRRVGDPAP